LVYYAVCAEWEKEKRPPAYYGYAATVDTNSDKPSRPEVTANKKLKLWIMLMRLGAMTGCHQMHERSLFFRGYQFPVCARCTGLFVGQAAGLAALLWFINLDIKLVVLCAAVSVAALGIDGFFQFKGIWVSTNFRRFLTGILCGFFVTGLLVRGVAMGVKFLMANNR